MSDDIVRHFSSSIFLKSILAQIREGVYKLNHYYLKGVNGFKLTIQDETNAAFYKIHQFNCINQFSVYLHIMLIF